MTKSFRFMITALIGALLAACSSGGGSGGDDVPETTLEGAVVDGYVRGATVTLYSTADFGGPAAVATGTTDANGDFSLTLPEEELPEYFALLSRGGTIIDTGLPAPTMALVALREQDRYYVTPLTDRALREGLRPDSGFFDAEERIATELGLTNTELYDDPMAANAPAALTDGLYRVLAAGDHSAILADGDYRLSLVHLDKNDIGQGFASLDAIAANNFLEGTVTVSDGALSGTLEGGDTVDGRVEGANVVMGIAYPDGDSDGSPDGVTQVAGTVGLLGSLSGSYVDVDGTGAAVELSSGVFVASLTPVDGLDASAYEGVVERLYEGNRNALFRDLYGDRDLAWGSMGSVTLDADAKNLAAANFSITLNAAGGPGDNLTFNEGRLLTASVGGETALNGLALLAFTDSSGDYAYLAQALGNRRGVYVAGDAGTDAAYAIGESYLARRDAVGGDAVSSLTGTDVALTLSAVTPHMLGQPRNPAAFVETGISFTVPAIGDGAGADGAASSAGGVRVVSGSMLGLKESAAGADTGAIDSSDDSIAVAELHATGAFQGDWVVGGNLAAIGGLAAADWPVPLAGFAAPSGTDTTLLELGDAQVDFLARPIYLVEPGASAPAVESYLLAYIAGTITSDGETATLTYRDAQGETGILELTVENRSGIYHLYGAMGDEYIDILWPAGGTRAVFLSSTAADGNGDIYEIGEAFLTY